MKATKAFFFAVLAAFVMVGCTNAEKILPKADGRWENSRVEAKTYVDGALASDTTLTNEGFTTFNSDGTGFSEDNDGNNTGDFEWSVNDDQLTITDDSTTTVGDILELSRKSFTLSISEEGDFFGSTIRVESVTELNRVD